MKLAANALLSIQVAAVAETLAALDKSGIAPKRALETISGLPVMSPAGNGFAGLMVAGDFAPQFTTALIAKDLRYAAAETRGRTLERIEADPQSGRFRNG
jgi:3-hydroxyisobutyrate dehydrogenase